MGLGKIAVVIGCGPATGGAVAKRFAQGGYSIALVSRKAESAKPVYDHITENGGKALMISADTGKEEDVKRAYKEIVDEFKASPEVLVYNARGGDFKWPPPKILDVNPADFEAQFAGGVTGALLWMQQLVPEQMKAKKGTIILTGATAGLRGGAGFSLLSPYKFALRSLGQTAAREFQPKGIHVAHVIVDGMIRTPQSKEYAKDVPEENFLQPDAIAEAYWNLHLQDRSAWTQELDLRPFTEKF